jgi:hypothetical protein
LKAKKGGSSKASKVPKQPKKQLSSKESKSAPANPNETRTVIYSIVNLTKVLPNRRVLFKDISLGFYQGAKCFPSTATRL